VVLFPYRSVQEIATLADLSRKRERERLHVRREPYWQRLAEGAYLGFRRGPDTWVARYRGRDGKQQYRALGEALEYDPAKATAEEWLAQLAGSSVRTVKRGTVKAALETYLADLKRHGRPDAARVALGQYTVSIYPTALAQQQLEDATREDFLDWRDRLLPTRQPRSVNRHVRAVVAGLNRAIELGHVGNPTAWKLQPLADGAEDESETAVFLSAEQRQALKDAAGPHTAAFLRGLELTGARPGELAVATVADFDRDTLRLAHRKGRPPRLRVRHVVLSAAGVVFFNEQTADKLPLAPIFTENGSTSWTRHSWAKRFRAAADKVNEEARGAARIPLEASAYSFRHARISELLQVYGVDPLTVAAQTGTGLRMIETAYHRFIASAMREKLAAVKESTA
jgi:integrase